MGVYFVLDTIVRATTEPYILVQDADDWSDSRRAAILLDRMRRTGAAAVLSSQMVYPLDHSGPRRVDDHDLGRAYTPKYSFRGLHTGLFERESLEAVGGYIGAYRINYDILLVNLVGMYGPIEYVNQALYHVEKQVNSLTTSASTGIGSPYRTEVRRELAETYAKCFPHFSRFKNGEISREELARRFQDITRSAYPSGMSALLTSVSARIRSHLEERNVQDVLEIDMAYYRAT